MKLEHPLMNAAGTCKLMEGDLSVATLCRSASAAVVVGSITVEERTGNVGGTNYWYGDGSSINSLGMPNPGLVYYRRYLPEMKRMANAHGKPLIVSVAGFSRDEFITLAQAVLDAGADGVELNFGCPNVIEKGKHEPIVSFEHSLVFDILFMLFKLKERLGPRAPVGVKLSPFSDPTTLAAVADTIGSSAGVRWVTSSNTFPKATAYRDDGKLALEVAGGFGGFAGPALKPIALGQVRQLRALLPKEIDVIGVGGVTVARDIPEFQRAGACAVQMATALLQNGPRYFELLLRDLVDPIVP